MAEAKGERMNFLRNIGFYALLLAVIVSGISYAYSLFPKAVPYRQIIVDSNSDMSAVGLQNWSKLFASEPNVYFAVMDGNVIMYCNMGKSGLYTHPVATVKKRGDVLSVQIDSNPKRALTNEDILIEIDLDKLPGKIEVYVLGEPVNDYRVIGTIESERAN
ncbi:hypothetical protein M6D81_01100 [Paenibacillus sp. J5C_2022]|uniref:hypothetical protein n=1 Tax=Paenibacillus sp. J5C2022 TaxID=2977129 RepID=UPI0021D28D99|nr:hypothetical protein [Paenibacillus sp. J5C2022]MCU6707291.1 hypothetical protein [Paenibacillus sp. J5C2022]